MASQRSPSARERAVYVISVAAELAGVHPQTLRIYERRGLLDPARTAGGNRRYSEADLARLERIAELTDEGLNLAGVRRVLELEEQLAAARREVAALRVALDAARARVAPESSLIPLSEWLRPIPMGRVADRDHLAASPKQP